MADTRLDKRIKLSGTLPSEDRENGLDHLTDEILDDPKGKLVFALAVMETWKVSDDLVLATTVPLLRIREIEAVALDDVPEAVMEYFRQLRTNRRGAEAEQDQLPETLDDHLDVYDEGPGEILDFPGGNR